jgi:hypothetical protein
MLYLCLQTPKDRSTDFGVRLIRWVQRFWGPPDVDEALRLGDEETCDVQADNFHSLVFRLVAVRRFDLVCMLIQAHGLSAPRQDALDVNGMLIDAPSPHLTIRTRGEAVRRWIRACGSQVASSSWWGDNSVGQQPGGGPGEGLSPADYAPSTRKPGSQCHRMYPLALLLSGRLGEAFDAYESRFDLRLPWAHKLAAHLYVGAVSPGGFEYRVLVSGLSALVGPLDHMDLLALSLIRDDWVSFGEACLSVLGTAPSAGGNNHLLLVALCAHLLSLVCSSVYPQGGHLIYRHRDTLLLGYIHALDPREHWQTCCNYCLEMDPGDEETPWTFLRVAPHLEALQYCEGLGLSGAARRSVAERLKFWASLASGDAAAASTSANGTGPAMCSPGWEPLTLALRVYSDALVTEAALLLVRLVLQGHLLGPDPGADDASWAELRSAYPIIEAVYLAVRLRCGPTPAPMHCRHPIPLCLLRPLLDRCLRDDAHLEPWLVQLFLGNAERLNLLATEKLYLADCAARLH